MRLTLPRLVVLAAIFLRWCSFDAARLESSAFIPRHVGRRISRLLSLEAVAGIAILVRIILRVFIVSSVPTVASCGHDIVIH